MAARVIRMRVCVHEHWWNHPPSTNPTYLPNLFYGARTGHRRRVRAARVRMMIHATPSRPQLAPRDVSRRHREKEGGAAHLAVSGRRGGCD
jgi:hypothetical protein